MADRFDREYDRDRSLWRDREQENRSGRDRGEPSEYGGSTRGGWGRGENDYGRTAGPDYGRGEQYGQRGMGREESGRGRSSQDWDQEQWRQYYERGQGQGQGQDAGFDRNYDQGWQRGGSQFGRGRGQGQSWQGGQGQWAGRQGGQGGRGDMDYGRGYSEDWRRQPGMGQGSEWNQGSGGNYDRDAFSSPVTWTYTEYWLIPGPFTGMGPSGYQRSVERIKEDICERLTQHGRLDARNIEIDVNESGEVTLTGTVESRQAKRMAEDAVESIPGVQDVHNQLRVKSGGQSGQWGQGGQMGQGGQSGQGGQGGQMGSGGQMGQSGQGGQMGQTGQSGQTGQTGQASQASQSGQTGRRSSSDKK